MDDQQQDQTQQQDQGNVETRYAVTDKKHCYEMQRKYGWTLDRVERTKTAQVPWDCVFDGDVEFPPSYMDLTAGDDDDE